MKERRRPWSDREMRGLRNGSIKECKFCTNTISLKKEICNICQEELIVLKEKIDYINSNSFLTE